MYKELQDTHRRIDTILDAVDEIQKETTAERVKKFNDAIHFELLFSPPYSDKKYENLTEKEKELFNHCNYHISKSTAKYVGATFPEHIHENETETVKVTRGAVSLSIPGKTILLEEGQSRDIPKGVPHSGTALTKNAQILSIIVPADPRTKRFKGYMENGTQ